MVGITGDEITGDMTIGAITGLTGLGLTNLIVYHAGTEGL